MLRDKSCKLHFCGLKGLCHSLYDLSQDLCISVPSSVKMRSGLNLLNHVKAPRIFPGPQQALKKYLLLLFI